MMQMLRSFFVLLFFAFFFNQLIDCPKYFNGVQLIHHELHLEKIGQVEAETEFSFDPAFAFFIATISASLTPPTDWPLWNLTFQKHLSFLQKFYLIFKGQGMGPPQRVIS